MSNKLENNEAPIESQRTTLRRLRLTDFENVRGLESDPLIMKFTPSKIPQTPEQTLARLTSQIAGEAKSRPFGIWVAENKADSSFIGWFMLRPESTEEILKNEKLELGFMILRSQFGKGFATEISRALVEYAFKSTNIKILMARTSADNFQSIKVLQKLSFKFKEMISTPDKVLGGIVDIKFFELINPKNSD